MDFEQRLIGLVRDSERVMGLLRAVRNLSLDDWCVAAGTIRNLVWDHLHGYTDDTLPTDVDVLIFDAATPPPYLERSLEDRLHEMVPAVEWEVVNQAIIHTYTGDPEPYRSIEHAMSRWADQVTAVGARLEGDDSISILAPGHLDDLFGLRVRPNLVTPGAAEVYRSRIASKDWLQRWPKLQIDPLPG